MIAPENYSYIVLFDNSVDKPTMEYKVYADGTVQLVQQEQTQLDVDGNSIHQTLCTIQKTIMIQPLGDFIYLVKFIKATSEIKKINT